jgi:glycosyltransferase involved in cell wall biosynthesis
MNQTLKKILIIRARYTDSAIRKVARSLHQEGYDVTLLIWDRSGKRSLSGEKNDYNIDYFYFRAPQDKLSVIFFLPIWWVYELFYIFKINPDIIHACDFDTQYPAIVAKIVRNKHFVYMIYDFYANGLPNGKFQWIRNSIRSVVANIEKIGIGFADLLILVDESRIEEVKGARINKLIFLYNAPDEINTEKKQKNANTSENLIVIFYAGIIHEQRGISDMITAVNDIENVELILAGHVANKAIITDKINEKIKFIGWIPTYEEIIEKTTEADILFRFSDPNHPKTKYESPNKLFEAMMCGKPIIVSDNSAMATIVRQNNCGIVVPYGDVDAIKGAIHTLKCDPDLRKKFGENGKKAYDQKYSWKIMEKRLVKAYENF